MRTYSTRDLVWSGLELRLGGRVLATVKPDPDWPKLYRVHIPGHVSDTVNLSRAKDAAVCLALAELNRAKAVRITDTICQGGVKVEQEKQCQRNQQVGYERADDRLDYTGDDRGRKGRVLSIDG